MVHRSSRTSVTPTDVKCVSCTDHIAVLRQEVGPVDPNETLKTIRALVDRTNAYGDEVPPFVLDLVQHPWVGWVRGKLWHILNGMSARPKTKKAPDCSSAFFPFSSAYRETGFIGRALRSARSRPFAVTAQAFTCEARSLSLARVRGSGRRPLWGLVGALCPGQRFGWLPSGTNQACAVSDPRFRPVPAALREENYRATSAFSHAFR
jgi:hypothetical protein